MRIISGKCRGRLIVPPKNLRARPTTDFAKENLFNILSNRYDFGEMDILDLFSGTGSISYEFASRGAASVTSVELNSVHADFIRQTAQKLGLSTIHPVKANAFLYLKSCRRKFDIVFADAPYDLPDADKIPDAVFASEVLKEGGVFIFEHSKDKNFWDHPNFCEIRSYGSVHFSIFKNFTSDDQKNE